MPEINRVSRIKAHLAFTASTVAGIDGSSLEFSSLADKKCCLEQIGKGTKHQDPVASQIAIDLLTISFPIVFRINCNVNMKMRLFTYWLLFSASDSRVLSARNIWRQRDPVSQLPLVDTTSSLPELHISLKPFYNSTNLQVDHETQKQPAIPNGIDVVLVLPAARFKSSETALLSYGLSEGPTPTHPYDGDEIRAFDERGDLPLRYIDSKANTDGDVTRTWYPIRAPVSDASITVSFFAPARYVDESTMIGPRIDLRRDAGGGLVGQGAGFIPVPPSEDAAEEWQVKVHWDLSKTPDGTHAAWSFGDDLDAAATPGGLRTVGTLYDIVTRTVFAVGQVKRFPGWDEKEDAAASNSDPAFAVYWFGDPPFDMQTMVKETEDAYRAIDKQFQASKPFRVFIRQVERGFGGSGATLSFLAEWSQEQAPQTGDYVIRDLLAHETVHEYALMQPNPEDDGDDLAGNYGIAWYNEGIAMYVAIFALVPAHQEKGNEVDNDFLLWQLNSVTQGYYTSPVVRMPWSEAAKRFWENVHTARVSYNRGFIYLAAVNSAIRKATDRKQSLDEIALELYARRMSGEPHGQKEWHRLVAAIIGEDEEKRLFQQMTNGDLIVPPDDTFAEFGVRLVREDAEMFELGFDSTSLRAGAMRVSGLLNDSRAEKAGVREGDEVVRAWMVTLAADDLEEMMQMTVRRDGREKDFRWWPRSSEKVESWKWVEDTKVDTI